MMSRPPVRSQKMKDALRYFTGVRSTYFPSGVYRLWTEPILQFQDYGDPEKKQRPKFLTMKELWARAGSKPVLRYEFADLLLLNLHLLDVWPEALYLFAGTMATDQYGHDGQTPYLCKHAGVGPWTVYLHTFGHASSPSAHFVCGQKIT